MLELLRAFIQECIWGFSDSFCYDFATEFFQILFATISPAISAGILPGISVAIPPGLSVDVTARISASIPLGTLLSKDFSQSFLL